MTPWFNEPAETPVNVRYPLNEIVEDVELLPQSIVYAIDNVPEKLLMWI